MNIHDPNIATPKVTTGPIDFAGNLLGGIESCPVPSPA